jgi:uncharacterized peroxidase-related enzyme
MAWIETIDEAHATGKLKAVYEEVTKNRGKLSNIMKIHSLYPEAMKKHMDLYLTLMFSSSELSREEQELIAVVVSSANQCEYCVNHHAEALNHYVKDHETVQRLIDDFRSVELSVRKQQILDYAFKLTKAPTTVDFKDVEKLKRAGFSDKAILTINLITSYFNFVNRIAVGLGVEFSGDEVKGYKY